MRSFWKKALSIAMSVVLVVGLWPGAAVAVDAPSEQATSGDLVAGLSRELHSNNPLMGANGRETETASDFIIKGPQIDYVPDGYIGIYSANDFAGIKNNLSGHFILMDDIDLTEYEIWDPIGKWYEGFSGTLDGNWHSVSGLQMDIDAVNDANHITGGLFGCVSDAEIMNLKVTGTINLTATIETTYLEIHAGGIVADVGYGSTADVLNCVSEVNISIDAKCSILVRACGIGPGYNRCCINSGDILVSSQWNAYADGIGGSENLFCANYGSVRAFASGTDLEPDSFGDIWDTCDACTVGIGAGARYCLNKGYISAEATGVSSAAGIGGAVAECANYGDVYSSGNFSATAAGIKESAGSITDCSNAGSITARSFGYHYGNAKAGGICADAGSSLTSSNESISNPAYAEPYIGHCYNIGDCDASAQGASYAGGILGAYAYAGSQSEESFSGVFPSCYYSSLVALIGESIGRGDDLVCATPDELMRSQSTYYDWDFDAIWQMDDGGYPYPYLRCLDVMGQLPNPVQEHPNSQARDASSEIVQLAACELATFTPGNGWVGKTVSDYLDSQAFVDEQIWGDSDATYYDLFADTIGLYTIVSTWPSGSGKHVALKHPVSGDVVIALDPEGVIGRLDTFAKITQSETPNDFNDALDVCMRIKDSNPESTLHVTGSFYGGMAASFVSFATGSDAKVFNAAPGFGAKLAWRTQAAGMTGNELEGVEDPPCTNFYASGIVDSIYSYGSDFAYNCRVSANEAGSVYRLNSLYCESGDTFGLCSYTSTAPAAVMRTFYMADFPKLLKSIKSTINGLKAGKLDLSFEELGKLGVQISIGTSGKDTKFTGMEGLPSDLILPQIAMTGAGDGDAFRGGQTADIFVAGSGSSRLYGEEGSDIYVVGDNAHVYIKDTCATDGNVMSDGAVGLFKLAVGWNLGQAALSKAGIEKIRDSLEKILKDDRQDTIILRGCTFEDMTINLVEYGVFSSNEGHFSGAYYRIQAGTSVVEVPRRSYLQSDYLVIDANAKAKNLSDLYALSNGGSVGALSAQADEGVVDATDAVTLHMMGEGLVANVYSVDNGQLLFSISSNESGDYCGEWGTFESDAELQCIDAAYRSSKLKVELTEGTAQRIITNAEVGEIDGNGTCVDGVDVSSFDSVSVLTDERVTLSGLKGGGYQTLDSSDVTLPDETYVDISSAEMTVDRQIYTGDELAPMPTITLDGELLEEGIDYTLSYSNNTSVGVGSVTATGTGCYTGLKQAEFEIVSASLDTATVTLSQTTYTYDGKAKKPGVTVKAGGAAVPTAGYDVKYDKNVNAGTATVTVTGKDGYAGTKSATFKINPAAITSASTTASCAYDGKAKTPGVTVKAGSLAVPASGYTVAYRNNVNAGTATVTVTGKGNYSGSRSATFKITPASLATATVALSQSAYTYDGKAKTPAATVKLGSKTLKAGTDYTVSYSNNVKPGLATATVTGKGNYSGTAKATFSIAAASTPSTPSVPAVSEPEPVPAYPLYRLFQPKTGEHHYTLSAEERDICTDRWGWTYEGVAWDCPEASATPVYRLFHPTIGLHHYTTSAEERDICTDRWGWQYEGVAWYADDGDSGMPVYRLFHPVTAHHHYTTSWDEVGICTDRWGWTYEGVAWYARE